MFTNERVLDQANTSPAFIAAMIINAIFFVDMVANFAVNDFKTIYTVHKIILVEFFLQIVFIFFLVYGEVNVEYLDASVLASASSNLYLFFQIRNLRLYKYF